MQRRGQSVAADVHPSVAGDTPAGTAFWSQPEHAADTHHSVGGGDAKALLPYIDPATTLDDSLEVVTQGFHWLGETITARIGDLKDDLLAVDHPSFVESLMVGALRAGLAGLTGGTSEFIVRDITDKIVREAVKSAIKTGVGTAVDAGLKKLGGDSKRDPILAFIASQQEMARTLLQEAQTSWIKSGRHSVSSVDEATRLETQFSRERMKEAAERQYLVSRDAWIAYLAQASLGAVQSKRLDDSGDIIDLGPTTNLGGLSVGESFGAGLIGAGDGVLFVHVRLPTLHQIQGSGLYGATGTPQILTTYLNGVNSTIRDQYVGQPLSQLHIPRVIIARVDEGDFTVRVNEKGISFDHGNRWLVERALVAHPENVGTDDALLEDIGRQLLLSESGLKEISKGATE